MPSLNTAQECRTFPVKTLVTRRCITPARATIPKYGSNAVAPAKTAVYGFSTLRVSEGNRILPHASSLPLHSEEMKLTFILLVLGSARRTESMNRTRSHTSMLFKDPSRITSPLCARRSTSNRLGSVICPSLPARANFLSGSASFCASGFAPSLGP